MNKPRKEGAAAQRDRMLIYVSRAYMVLNRIEPQTTEIQQAIEYLDLACKVASK